MRLCKLVRHRGLTDESRNMFVFLGLSNGIRLRLQGLGGKRDRRGLAGRVDVPHGTDVCRRGDGDDRRSGGMQIRQRGAVLSRAGGIKGSVRLPAGPGARGARAPMGERVGNGVHVGRC